MSVRKSFNAGSVKRKAFGIARSTAVGAKKLARIAKLNMEISSRKDSIRHTYTEIGKLYYEAHRDEPEGFFTEYFRKIDIDMSEIAEFEKEKASLKEDVTDLTVPEDVEFEAVPEETEEDAEPEEEITTEGNPDETASPEDIRTEEE